MIIFVINHIGLKIKKTKHLKKKLSSSLNGFKSSETLNVKR